jgi:hypothetical protein
MYDTSVSSQTVKASEVVIISKRVAGGHRFLFAVEDILRNKRLRSSPMVEHIGNHIIL